MNGNDGYEPIPTGDMIPLIGREVIPASESCMPLPEVQFEHDSYRSPDPSSTLEMGREKEQSQSQTDGLDIHLVQLLTYPDFYLIITLCKFGPVCGDPFLMAFEVSGTGIICEVSFYHCKPSIDLDTDINNVGSKARPRRGIQMASRTSINTEHRQLYWTSRHR